MSERTLSDSQRWLSIGTQLFGDALSDLNDPALGLPSALEGWTRAHIVAHLVGNARALLNLVTWARTGVETPMYASQQQRLAEINSGALLPAWQLRHSFAQSSTALAEAMTQLGDVAWHQSVRSAQGRTLSAFEIPWLRAREVMIHSTDLRAGVTFAQLPDDFLRALVDDVIAKRSATAGHQAIVLDVDRAQYQVMGKGKPIIVSASLSAAAAYLTGRDKTVGPAIPPWL